MPGLSRPWITPPASSAGCWAVNLAPDWGLFCFDAFSSREPVPTPHLVRGRLSLENAMSAGFATGIEARARLLDLGLMRHRPSTERFHRLRQAASQVRQFVVDPRRNGREYGS